MRGFFLYIAAVFMASDINAQSFALQKDIREHLWEYLHESKIVAFSDSTYLENGLIWGKDPKYGKWHIELNDFIDITDMESGEKIRNNDDLKDIGIYGFELLYYHPVRIYLFITYHDSYTIFPAKGYGNCSFSLMMRQLLDFFESHEDLSDMQKINYMTIMYNTYIETLIYME